MVRKAVRSLSAIEAAFKDLDVKEKKIRSYFQPMSDEEKNAMRLGAANWLIRTKHRHADVLNWQDDSSTILSIDAPAGERHLRAQELRVPNPRPGPSPHRSIQSAGPLRSHPASSTPPPTWDRPTSASQQAPPHAAATSPSTSRPTSSRSRGDIRPTSPHTADASNGAEVSTYGRMSVRRPVSAPAVRRSGDSPLRHATSGGASPHRQSSPHTPRKAADAGASADADSPGGANAAALAVALQQAADTVRRPAPAGLPAPQPPPLMLQKYAAKFDLHAVSAQSVGATVVTPISKRPHTRNAPSSSGQPPVDPSDTNPTMDSVHNPNAATTAGAPHAALSNLAAFHPQLVRFNTMNSMLTGTTSLMTSGPHLPPMPIEHPHQQAGAAVLTPADEDRLLLAVAQATAIAALASQQPQSASSPPHDDNAADGLTPEARLMYLGHATKHSIRGTCQRRPRQRSGSRSPGASSSGCSSPAGPSSRDISPLSAAQRRPWSASATVLPTSTSTRGRSSSPAGGHTGSFTQDINLTTGVGVAANKPAVATGRPPLARPQSARPASAHQQQSTSTSKPIPHAAPMPTAGGVAPFTPRSISPLGSDADAPELDVKALRTSSSPPRTRPWSAAPTLTTRMSAPIFLHSSHAPSHSPTFAPAIEDEHQQMFSSENDDSEEYQLPAYTDHATQDNQQDQHYLPGRGASGAGGPVQHVIARRVPQAHLAVITPKGQREIRRRASWAASAPMRPQSAPSTAASHARPLVDCGLTVTTLTHPLESPASSALAHKSMSVMPDKVQHHSSRSTAQLSTPPRAHQSDAPALFRGASTHEEAAALLAAEQARRDLGIIEDDEDEEGFVLDGEESVTAGTQNRGAGQGGSAGARGTEHRPSHRLVARTSGAWSLMSDGTAGAGKTGEEYSDSASTARSGRSSASRPHAQARPHSASHHTQTASSTLGRSTSPAAPTAEQSGRANALNAARRSVWETVATMSGVGDGAGAAADAAVASGTSGGGVEAALGVGGALQGGVARPPVRQSDAPSKGLRASSLSGIPGGLLGALTREMSGRRSNGMSDLNLGQVRMAVDDAQCSPFEFASSSLLDADNNVAAWLASTNSAARLPSTSVTGPPETSGASLGGLGKATAGDSTPAMPNAVRGLRWKVDVEGGGLGGGTDGGEIGSGEGGGARRAVHKSPGSAASSIRNRNQPSPDDSSLYQLTAQVQLAGLPEAPPSLAGWRFNVYVSDLGREGSRKGVRVCVARGTTADSRHRILVPVHGASGTASSKEYMDRDAEYQAHNPGQCTPTLSMADLLPWVTRPRDLHMHWLRLEAFSVVPTASKVLDAFVYMCGPQDDVPGQAPDVTKMIVSAYKPGSAPHKKRPNNEGIKPRFQTSDLMLLM